MVNVSNQPMLSETRVAFLISDQSLIQSGGIGQFTKAFVEMAHDLGWVVDLILDRPPRFDDSFLSQFADKLGRVFTPHETQSYRKHQEVFAFTDSVNFEKQTAFRDSFMAALGEVMYDMIICNVPEAYMPVYSTGIAKYVPTIFYTHNESMVKLAEDGIGPYSKEYLDVYRLMFHLPNIYVATQTQSNVDRLYTSGLFSVMLGMPLSERGLLEDSSSVEKSGVLFIGRWEERKNPAEFLRVIQETGLPAKVMTNSNGARKFKEAFNSLGITDYEIVADAALEQKVQFIKSAKVFYNTSVKESFGYTMIETIGHMHVVTLNEYAWSEEFAKYPTVSRVSKKDVVKTIKDLYTKEVNPGGLSMVQKYQKDAFFGWQLFADLHYVVGSDKNRSEVSKKDDFWYHEHMHGLNRTPSVEDIEVCYKARGKDRLHALQTPMYTWLSTRGTAPSSIKTKTCVDIFS